MKKIILAIDGMTCSACSNGLEKYLNKQKGIQLANVNLVMATALIEYDENILSQKQLEEFVKQAGFKSKGIYKEDKNESKSKAEKTKLTVFSILAIAMMYVSMGQMIGLPIPNAINMMTNPTAYVWMILLMTLPFIWYGYDILKNGYKNIIHGTPNMDTLVAIGVISSLVYSIFNMIMILKGKNQYVESLYFESAAVVIFFIKLGRYINGISTDKTKEAIQKLVQITPKDAIIKVEGQEKKVTIDEIKKGDIVIAKPGEKIAVDGEIILGESHLDESFITGESKPVKKWIGSKVIAGSINYDGYIEYKAEKIGKESTISEIVKLVVQATSTKAPIAKVADRVSSYFVPAVMAIAILTLMVYLIIGKNLSSAINAFVTILVVACPCSLGLATPLAIVVSEGICASNGILVKNSEILENAQKTTTVVFDKTGTLTYGKLKIAEIINYSKYTNNELLRIVGSIETKSTHPIGKAFTEYLKENKLEIMNVSEVQEISGLGITAKVNETETNNIANAKLTNEKMTTDKVKKETIDTISNNNKITVLLGNSKILEKYNIENKHKENEINLAKKGDSIVYVIINNEISAIIGVNDIVKTDARETIFKINKMGIETIMLTGDNSQVANIIANNIGITSVIANVTPNEKAETIAKLKKQNKYVLMCGDGINDSPALASSDIGISVNMGTDIAMDSSDVILTKNELYSIINLINISKSTIKNIKQNLFWAFFYNCLMIPIAMGVLQPINITINPMIASISMMISSFTVILNALRLKGIKLENTKCNKKDKKI